MIIAPAHGFVLLSLPKVASTSLDAALTGYHQALPGPAPGKHQNVRDFHRITVPRIDALGYPREAYDVVAMFRDPVEWLESWWRYRRRPDLRGRRDDRWTGDITWPAFVRLFLDDKPATGIRGRPVDFVRGDDGARLDRLFAIARPDVWTAWFSARVGAPIDVPRRNEAGPVAVPDLPTTLRSELTSYFAPEYEVMDHLGPDGAWRP